MSKNLAIVITGPTASGKSALAVNLAQKLNTEIISADSRQIYKGIPIVTAVPTEEEKKGVTHHLLETLELEDYYSASRFEEDSLRIIKDLFKRRDKVVVCGGSMLYIDTLIKGIDELPTVTPELINSLMAEWKENGDEWLLDRLINLDPVYYQNSDLKNLKRVFHAVEVSIMANAPYSSLLNKTKPKRDFDILKVTLSGDRNYLFDRINRRVLKMIENGLEEEARNVFHLRHLNSLNTVGIKEMFSFFEGKMTRDEAIQRIQKNTRVYAKKQETWHKRDNSGIKLDFSDDIEKNTESILKEIK